MKLTVSWNYDKNDRRITVGRLTQRKTSTLFQIANVFVEYTITQR